MNKARAMLKAAIRQSLSHRSSRALLNVGYLSLGILGHRYVHRKLGRIFRGTTCHGGPGVWKVRFLGKTVDMPLRPESMWLDWETAVSVIGHDTEVKETYARILHSELRPDLFIDIGGNYGTHSILLLTQGIETITFEPNPACHGYFVDLCALNGVLPDLEPCALGAEPGDVELTFPEKETWLGTVSPEIAETMGSFSGLTSIRIPRSTLDQYLPRFSSRRTLIKIDAEGSEIDILKGASATLERNRPLVLFECWKNDERPAILDLLHSHRYAIAALPWSPEIEPLTAHHFLSSPATNFIALPSP